MAIPLLYLRVLLTIDLIWLLHSSVGAFAITFPPSLFAVLGVQLLILQHVHLPLLAVSIGECASQCFVLALPVWS